MKKCCWLYAGERIATYSACTIGKTISELVEDFNTEIEGSDAQDRIYYRQAILQAIEEKGIDVSAVDDVEDFSKRINFVVEERKLEIVD